MKNPGNWTLTFMVLGLWEEIDRPWYLPCGFVYYWNQVHAIDMVRRRYHIPGYVW